MAIAASASMAVAAASASPAAAAAAAVAAVESDHASSLLGLASDAPVFLSSRLCTALSRSGIRSLYTHQAHAIRLLLGDDDHHDTAVAGQRAPAIVVATQTASGKSLCFTIPILETLLADPHARAILIYPTKALAQDQLRSIREFMCSKSKIVGGGGGIDPSCIVAYDGDTPYEARSGLRVSARVILTNPDMIHASILPSHREFRAFFTNMKFVVLDETHVYTGHFGSHVAGVIRRLRRLCRFYTSTCSGESNSGSQIAREPQFVCCSATLSNARECVAKLLGMSDEAVSLVDEDGSARGEKHFILWNPPRTTKAERAEREATEQQQHRRSHQSSSRSYEFTPFLDLSTQGSRRSAHIESSILLANLVQLNYRTLCFVGSRKGAEMVRQGSCELLANSNGAETRALAGLVATYRGGYTATHRRHIESRLFSGALRACVATCALELGIDVGTIDTTLHVGIPNSVSSLWQQAGRAGRSSNGGQGCSLAILVARDSPLDQYFMNVQEGGHEELFRRPPELNIIDVMNPFLMRSHMLCAAAELPLCLDRDAELFGREMLQQFLQEMTDPHKSWLAKRPRDPNIPAPYFDGFECFDLVNGIWEKEFAAQHQQNQQRGANGNDRTSNHDLGPSSYFSLRSSIGCSLPIMDATTGQVIDESDTYRAMFELHEGASYTNQGREYVVVEGMGSLTSSSSESKATAAGMGMVKNIRVKPLSAASNYSTRPIDRKWTTITSRILAFSSSVTLAATAAVAATSGKIEQQMKEEQQQEEKIPENISVNLATMHARLTSSIVNDLSFSLRTSFSPSSSAASATDIALSQSLSQWYLKSENSHDAPSYLHWRDLCAYGRVRVASSVFGFRKICKRTGKILERKPLTIPLYELETFGAWIDLPNSIKVAFAAFEQQRLQLSTEEIIKEEEEKNRSNKRFKREPAPLPTTIAAASSSSSTTTATPSSSLHSIHAALHGLTHCMIALLPM